MQARHAVREGVDSSEPVVNLGCEVVGDGLHSGNVVTGHSNVEEEEERYGDDVDPEHRQRDPVGHVPVIEVNRVKEGGEGRRHESHDVKVGQHLVQCGVAQLLLDPQDDISLYGVDIGRHVELCAGHQDPVHPVQQILPQIDGEDHYHMRPVASEHVDETLEPEFRIRRLEQRHHRYAEDYRTCNPGDVDASARCHAPDLIG